MANCKKLIKKWIHVWIFLLAVTFCWIFVMRYGMFGSMVDWISQHSVFPDYFRKQFYQTGQIFPDIAFQIGAGQNIYNFAYYGFLSPWTLLSYFFPFIEMADYMMIIQVFCYGSSGVLFYEWLREKNIQRGIGFGVTMIFLLSGPMLFHSYNQIMFVNYMPFLCTAFLGMERFLKKRKKLLLIFSVFFMIMTSFYFSIGGMLALSLYALSNLFWKKEKFRTIFELLLSFGIAVLMSGVLILPSAFALLGRGGGNFNFSIGQLFIPQIAAESMTYSPYGIGLTTFGVTSLLASLLWGRKEMRTLAAFCFVIWIIPIFACVLNGGLYIRYKVLIPVLPLYCFMIASYVQNMLKKMVHWFPDSIPYFLSPFVLILLSLRDQSWKVPFFTIFWLLDSIVMLVFFDIYKRKKCYWYLLFPMLFMLLLAQTALNWQGNRTVNAEFYEKISSSDISEQISNVMKNEKEICRVDYLGNAKENAAYLNRVMSDSQWISSLYSSAYNPDYQFFRKEVFHVEQPFRNILMQSASYNPIFWRTMGIKYIVSEKEIPALVPVIEIERNMKIYKNEESFPLAYTSDRFLSKELYEKLKFPYNQLALLHDTVVNQSDSKKTEHSQFQKLLENIFQVREQKVDIPKKGKANKEQKLMIPLREKEKDVLFLKCTIENQKPSQDVMIEVNGVRNKLSAYDEYYYYNENTVFYWAIPIKKNSDFFSIRLGKGDYRIHDIQCYTACLGEGENRPVKREVLLKQTSGNQLTGEIITEQEEFLVTSIPYDSAFEVKVNGETVELKRANTAFWGFWLARGENKVELTYHAPGKKWGICISIVGVILFLVVIVYERYQEQE